MTFRAGDVVHYESITQPSRWCRENMAIAHQRVDRVVFLDTFWGSGGDQHALTAEEIETAELLFNLDDYDELDQYSQSSPRAWEKFAPADRRIVTSQHGLQKRWFVRKGAVEDWPTEIQNAKDVVAQREHELRSAQLGLDYAREELIRVVANADTAKEVPLDVYVVMDGAVIVGISAKLQGAELIRGDAAKRIANGEWAQNGRDAERWRESQERAYARLRIENHEVVDIDE